MKESAKLETEDIPWLQSSAKWQSLPRSTCLAGLQRSRVPHREFHSLEATELPDIRRDFSDDTW